MIVEIDSEAKQTLMCMLQRKSKLFHSA